MLVDFPIRGINVPFYFCSSSLGFEEFKLFINDLVKIKFKSILIASGVNKSKESFNEYVKYFDENFSGRCIKREIEFGSIDEVRSIDFLCSKNDVDMMIAIGGGKVLDVCKFVAKRRNIFLLVIPSTLSSDCIASPISVLLNEKLIKNSFASTIPNAIFIDLNIISKSPDDLILSGVGDLISNVSACSELNEKNDLIYRKYGLSILLSMGGYRSLISTNCENIHSLDFIDNLASGLMLSGLSMCLSGDSKPCSGSEHLISHSLDHLLGKSAALHGLQVALGTKFCFFARKQIGEKSFGNEFLVFYKSVKLPSSPLDLNIDKDSFLKAIVMAPKIRPGRYSYISEMSALQIKDAFSEAFE